MVQLNFLWKNYLLMHSNTQIQKFTQVLTCKGPHTRTHIHYRNDLQLFFAWANKPPVVITVSDVDAYITHCQAQGQAIAAVSRQLVVLCLPTGILPE